MFSNFNVVKYSSKYFFLMVGSAYVLQMSTKMVNAKNDVKNLIGSALFAGLFLMWVLILKSDVTKLVSNIKVNENKENKNEE